MGILGSLFGWDKSLGALNAVLASNLLELSSASTRQEVARGGGG